MCGGGTWKADFKYDKQTDSTYYTGTGTVGVKTYLKPGETVHTPLIATVRYYERNEEAVNGDSIIYVILEKEHLKLLPEQAIRILVTADLELIKKRFSARMQGSLPMQIEKMLEKKHGCFDNEKYDFKIDSQENNIEDILNQIQEKIFN